MPGVNPTSEAQNETAVTTPTLPRGELMNGKWRIAELLCADSVLGEM